MKPNPLYLIPAVFMTAAMLPLVPFAIVLRFLNDQPPQAHFPSIRCPACGECNCDECRRLREAGATRFQKIREMRERFRS